MSKNKQKINCNVESCEYNNCNNKECTLNEIKVSCDCGCNKADVTNKSETICSSFKSITEKE